MNDDNNVDFKKDLKPYNLCKQIAEYILKIIKGTNYTEIDRDILSKNVSMHIIDIDAEKSSKEGNRSNAQPKENGK